MEIALYATTHCAVQLIIVINVGTDWIGANKMEYNINEKIISESIQRYGKNNQSTVCMEECAELIQAISKAKRGKIDRDNMIEEIADVLICIEMLKQMYMISDEKINKWIEKKQAREVKRISQNELLQLHRQSNCMDFNRCYCVCQNLLH